MLVQNRQAIDLDVWIEFHARWDGLPACAGELAELGVSLLDRSRVLRIESGGVRVDLEQMVALGNPLTEDIELSCPPDARHAGACVDVFCRPGVTDAEGDTATLALTLVGRGATRCHAGVRYRFAQPIPTFQRNSVERLLGNPLIHQFIWHDRPQAPHTGAAPLEAKQAQTIGLENLSDEQLLTVSRRHALALDLVEMQAIVSHFHQLQRAPTDVELQSIALAWSEHCSHKTFKAPIRFDHDGHRSVIQGLLHECIVEPSRLLKKAWVRSAFVDNAGVIAFDNRFDLAFKVETHNHPSALEPFGGSHTGVGGVIRDVLAVSAEPIANTDVLCFGPLDLPLEAVPPGVFHPTRTFREVVRGVADYGNNMGIPTVGGAVLFDPGYTANPLVYCGTLGIAPRGSHPRAPQAGDRIVLLGGQTGRDGLHGATMSSETLDRGTVESSTVQIGAPITEKTLRDVLPHLRDERLYHAITDCGAGGLCSAVGEMGEQFGVDVELANVPLKYAGLAPWEIWLSEAQERLVLAVPDDSLPRLLEICQSFDLDASVIGRFRGDGQLRLSHDGESVADLEMSFLHGGRPTQTLEARWRTPTSQPYAAGDAPDAASSLLRLLAHPTIASKEEVIRRYDHEVGAATIIKPLTGNGGPADAAVLQPLPCSWRGAILAYGINPIYGRIDPHAMALLAVDEALRNIVATGGSIDRVALLDNFCWGDVDDPAELGALVRAAEGCRDASLGYRVPFICGKDSLRNTSADGAGRHSIPRTLLISALGVVPDVRRCVTMDLKQPHSRIYLLGQTADELGGSHYLLVRDEEGGQIPRVAPRVSRRTMRAVTRAIRRGLVLSCHDLSEGGLSVAAAEMSIAGALGIELDLAHMPASTEAAEALLFSESAGRFLVEVAADKAEAFEQLFSGIASGWIGQTTSDARFLVKQDGRVLIDLPVEEIDRAWKGGLGVAAVVQSPVHEIPVTSVRNEYALSAAPRGRTPRRAAPRVLVLTAAGINCDRETAEACRLAGAQVELVHLNRLIAGDVRLSDFGMLVIPGGFSYGDHLGAGAMLANMLRHRFLGEIHDFIASGRPVLGVCNGFQVLSRLGLLGDVALAPNITGRFECRWVRLEVNTSECVFLRDLGEIELPVAHGEGRVVASPEALPEVSRRAPLRYLDNPNGSMANIAGVCNPAGNVLGLMPHPERYVTRYQHPARSSAVPHGLIIFRNAMHYVGEL